MLVMVLQDRAASKLSVQQRRRSSVTQSLLGETQGSLFIHTESHSIIQGRQLGMSLRARLNLILRMDGKSLTTNPRISSERPKIFRGILIHIFFRISKSNKIVEVINFYEDSQNPLDSNRHQRHLVINFYVDSQNLETFGYPNTQSTTPSKFSWGFGKTQPNPSFGYAWFLHQRTPTLSSEILPYNCKIGICHECLLPAAAIGTHQSRGRSMINQNLARWLTHNRRKSQPTDRIAHELCVLKRFPRPCIKSSAVYHFRMEAGTMFPYLKNT